MRTVLWIGLALFVLLAPSYCPEPVEAQDDLFPPQSQRKVRESLFQELTNEGFKPAFVHRLLYDKRWELSLLILEKNLIYRESKANYLHFLDAYSTALARDFLGKNRVFLEETERRYGVDKEVIVAILLIESSFGEYSEKYRVFNALSSLSQANHPEVFRLAFDHLKESHPDLTKDYFRERAERKSRWAFQELKAFLEIGIREDLDILEVKGSYAGAFGIPQFIPTSYLTYGTDGNGDNNIHLHDRYDAIVSVANYLKAHGWKPGLTKEEMMKVLFRYNRSRLYGETVLKCAEKLKNHQVSFKRSHQKSVRGGS